ELRWQSTTDYSALTTTPASWDFGDQVIKVNGPAKTFTFHNRGSLAVNLGTGPTVSGATTGFALAADTCYPYPHSIAVGASCSITVVPHPQFAVSSTYSGSVGVLHLIPDGLPDQAVQLREEGRESYSIWLQPGPSRIRFNWGQLPGTIGASLVNYTVYRGTSATNLMPLRQVAAGVMTTVDNSVTPGRVYYYAVQPNYTDQSGGKSPRVAAEAWPKYSSGMYHRLATPARLLSSHSVNAGHPYSLKVLGGHGIPGSHVSAVALNVTAAKPSQTTSVTVYPGGSNRPAQSDLTLAHGSTRSNFALVKVGSTGRITISTSHGTTPVTVDVSGYYSATGLSATYGTGAAGHTFVDSSWILDTKRQGFGPLPHDYYIDAPVDFDPLDTPHITSLAVRITAYGSTGSGSIAAYATGGRLPATSVLSYSANSTTSNYAIVSAGRFFGNNGQPYPSIAFLNRGARPVHLIVTITGYYDDDTFWFGERYTPTAPVHLGVANPLYAGGLRTISPGNHAHTWTAAMNLKIAASAPTATTTLALWPRGISGIGAPAHGQLHANAHQSTVASTPVAVGIGNRFFLRNAAGRTSVNLWSFGTFEAWPAPSARSYASDGTVSAGTPRSAPGPLRTAHHPVRLR
ncbi:MAG: hypothetical protein QOG01_81, partial [Pseudonocardiales bacterium]|nr:hypothetical protein [Pseudonocardiales bacterium]